MSVGHSTSVIAGVDKFGCLTPLSRRQVGKRAKWLCRCDCGCEKEVREDRLKSGRIVSCGCKRSRIGRTHGGCRSGAQNSRTYRAWGSMLSRCNNPNHKSYPDYGGRGIRVCERWTGPQGYPNFLADMGLPPQGMSLDRRENCSDYEPGNCRWATRKQQQRNTRHNRLITWQGRTQPLAAWADETGLEEQTIAGRLGHGWSVEQALSTPSLRPSAKGAKRSKYGG